MPRTRRRTRAPGRRRERLWRERGARRVAGIDEAGRGPLAGPVVAAAVVLPEDVTLRGVRDSKLLPDDRLETLFARVVDRAEAVSWCAAGPSLIDRVNILRASHVAMRVAVDDLPVRPDVALIDGHLTPDVGCQAECVVKGDMTELVIACASIVAKVVRDRMMALYDAVYAGYGFARHHGYPTPEHLAAIDRLGACPIHRYSFAPVAQARLML